MSVEVIREEGFVFPNISEIHLSSRRRIKLTQIGQILWDADSERQITQDEIAKKAYPGINAVLAKRRVTADLSELRAQGVDIFYKTIGGNNRSYYLNKGNYDQSLIRTSSNSWDESGNLKETNKTQTDLLGEDITYFFLTRVEEFGAIADKDHRLDNDPRTLLNMGIPAEARNLIHGVNDVRSGEEGKFLVELFVKTIRKYGQIVRVDDQSGWGIEINQMLIRLRRGRGRHELLVKSVCDHYNVPFTPEYWTR